MKKKIVAMVAIIAIIIGTAVAGIVLMNQKPLKSVVAQGQEETVQEPVESEADNSTDDSKEQDAASDSEGTEQSDNSGTTGMGQFEDDLANQGDGLNTSVGVEIITILDKDMEAAKDSLTWFGDGNNFDEGVPALAVGDIVHVTGITKNNWYEFKFTWDDTLYYVPEDVLKEITTQPTKPTVTNPPSEEPDFDWDKIRQQMEEEEQGAQDGTYFPGVPGGNSDESWDGEADPW